MARTEENEEYNVAIEECALGLNVADNVATEVKASAEEGATATGATSKAPTAVTAQGQGKGKGGYGKSPNPNGKGPEAWPVPLKVVNKVQK
jgi:hypothetical protein